MGLKDDIMIKKIKGQSSHKAFGVTLPSEPVAIYQECMGNAIGCMNTVIYHIDDWSEFVIFRCETGVDKPETRFIKAKLNYAPRKDDYYFISRGGRVYLGDCLRVGSWAFPKYR